MSDASQETNAHPGPGHESSDVSVRGVLWFAAGLVAFGIAVHLVLAGLFAVLAGREDARKASTFPLAEEQRQRGQALPPAPRLEGIERKRYGAAPEPGDYGWVDEKAGLVRIPIDRALERALSEGRFQSRPGDARWRGRLDGLPSDSSSGRKPWGGRR